MVKGVAELHAKIQKIKPRLEAALRPVLEAQANALVAQMNTIKPLPNIKIAWTWGKPPFRSISFGTLSGPENGPRITVYATADASSRAGGLPAIAAWFEFGTAERFRKLRGLKLTKRNQLRRGIVGEAGSTGKITAQPYFYPVYRANKSRIRSAISRAVTKEIKAIGPL